MKYLALTLPTDPTERATRITFERSQGGTFYQRPDSSVVLVRTSWPFPSASLVSLDTIPGDWVELTS